MTAALTPDHRSTARLAARIVALSRLNADIARETERCILVLAQRNAVPGVVAALRMVHAIATDLEHFQPHAITAYLRVLVESIEAGRLTDAMSARLTAAANQLVAHAPNWPKGFTR